MKAEDQIIMHKKRLAKPSEVLSAGQISLESKSIAAILDGMQRRIIVLESQSRRGDAE